MATVDLSNLIEEPEAKDPKVIKLGDLQVTLPNDPPASFISALGGTAWATEHGSDADKAEAGFKLTTVIVDLCGPIADKVGLEHLVHALVKVWDMGESIAS